MIWIGICGSSGSGKSTVCEIFQEYGFAWLDCDAIYHELVSAPGECLSAIGKRYGNAVISEGKLNRAMLREIFLKDPSASFELGRITHPHVIEELGRRSDALEKNGAFACLIDAPMLFESKLDSRCDFVIGVTAEEPAKLSRLSARDGISSEQAYARWKNQMNDRTLNEKCDLIIENNGTLEELRSSCKEAIFKIARTFELKGL